MTIQGPTNYTHQFPNYQLNDVHQAMTYNAAGEPVLRTVVNTAQATGQTLSGYTSKNRLKVSPYETIFFNTFQYGLESDVWETSTTGTASAVFNSSISQIDLAVGSTTGDKVIRQTKNVMRYIPGRSGQLSTAAVFGSVTTGVRKRIGLWDGTNGAYFEQSGTVDGSGNPIYNCVISNGGAPIVVPNADWNGNKLDGQGDNEITIDYNKIQLFFIEYEWYGAGQVGFGFIIEGAPYTVHTFNTANNFVNPWSATPFLPIRIEMENIDNAAGTHTMVQGSNSLILEGTVGKLGEAISITSPITGTNMQSGNNWYPVLSIRLKSTTLAGVVLPASFQAATLDNTGLHYKLVRNATIPAEVTAGQNGPQPWLNHPAADSFTQYQTYINPNSIAEIAQGSQIDSGYITAASGSTIIQLNQDSSYQLGRTDIGTVSEVLTLLAAPVTGNKDALAQITWVEQR